MTVATLPAAPSAANSATEFPAIANTFFSALRSMVGEVNTAVSSFATTELASLPSQPSDAATFATVSDAFVATLPGLVTDVNDLITELSLAVDAVASLPSTPSRSEDAANFTTEGPAFVAALPELRTDLNTFIAALNAYDPDAVLPTYSLSTYQPTNLAVGTQIIARGTSLQFDERVREIGNVLYDPSDTGKEFKLVYTGYQGTYDGNDTYIGYAYSTDGLSWTKATRFTLGADRHSEDPYLVRKGATYYLYVEDKEDVPFRDIRCYTSTDFATWTDRGEVLGPTGAGWEATDVSSPVVWIEGSAWYMLYEGRGTGQEGAIGLATSTNGLSWTRSGSNPVFVGTNATFSFAGVTWSAGISPDDIKKVGSTYVLSIHGRKLTGDNTYFRGGIATSTNLTTWTDSLSTQVGSIAAPDGSIMFNPTMSALYFHYAYPGGGIVRAQKGAGDANWANVSLYLSGYEYDGITRFYDLSPSWHTDTAVGNVQIDDAVSGLGPSAILFDGSGDRITFPDSTAFNFANGAFTIRVRGRFRITETGANVFCSQYATGSRAWAFDYFNNTLRFSYSTDGTTTAATLTFAWTQAGGTFKEFLISRDGSGNVRCFVDGTQVGSTQAANVTIFNSTAELWVGAIETATPANDFDGHMELLQIVKGVALRTANYTPSAAPYLVGPV